MASSNNTNVNPRQDWPEEDAFLSDLRNLCTSGSLSDTEKLQRIALLSDSRLKLHTTVQKATKDYLTHRAQIMDPRISISSTQNKILSLGSLPDDVILAMLHHFDALSVIRFYRTSRKFNELIIRFEQPIWRAQVYKRWRIPVLRREGSNPENRSDPGTTGAPTVDELLSPYFLNAEAKWKRVYEEMHNVYTGQYRFNIAADLDDRESRNKRQELVNQMSGQYVRRNRRYVLHCGQPTVAGSGYAVSLRLCGSWLCWISNEALAVCKVDGHTPHLLQGHTATLVCLAVNQRNLVVTGSEDRTMRLWDLDTLDCEHIFTVDILDVAMHEQTIVSYNNDNIVMIWDARSKDTIGAIDLCGLDGVDQRVLNKEVKVAVWGDTIVCGFENAHFLVLSKSSRSVLQSLSEPELHRRDDQDSTQYPTVLALFDRTLVSRGVRCHELCIWDVVEGQLLYRLSESISFLQMSGFFFKPNEVITDFTLDASGSFLMCTVENENTDVYLLSWDFRNSVARPRYFEKRSLESIAGKLEFDYSNFWLCYETV
ncbi:WD40-repeat-containing domain protein [Cladochytrium replicatum]|nr:WD40-repeat-containing domain protein [Cladochytrium replicatum]